jgi:amino acid transporter
MSDKDIELVTRAETEDLDDIAVQEAIEDEKTKTERADDGGSLERYINYISAINFGFILQVSWIAAAMTFQFSLLNGGPASMIYGSIFAGIGTTLVAVSMAEMASMDPTVGAQYRWSARFAPKYNEFFGLMQGWLTVLAWICTCTSNPAAIANGIIALAVFNYPEYVPERWHITMTMWAAILLPFFCNFYFRKLVNPVETFGAISHVVLFIVSIVTLVTLAERSTAEFVFTTLTHDVSGWKNSAVSWGIGLLTVTFPLTGFDGVLHMSDEVKRARVRVPRSMIFSVVLNAIMQFAFILTLCFTMGDQELLATSALPIIQVFYQATGSKGATNFFVVMFIIIAIIAFFNIFASVSRLAWAFARDRGLPFSKTFSYVHPTLKMPLNALILIGVCLFLLAIVNIASSTAFNALISLPTLALYLSYFFPILFLFIRKLTRSMPIPYGPFKLGRWGIPINIGAICYLLFTMIWIPFPIMLPVTRDNMNYAGPVLGAVLLCAVADWCISGRKRFKVPVARPRPDF